MNIFRVICTNCGFSWEADIDQRPERCTHCRRGYGAADMGISIEARLPVTADNVPVIPLMDSVWHPDDLHSINIDYGRRIVARTQRGKGEQAIGPWEAVPDPTLVMSEYTRRSVSECYSTREAAEKARREKYENQKVPRS